jgi:hypothetical protein
MHRFIRPLHGHQIIHTRQQRGNSRGGNDARAKLTHDTDTFAAKPKRASRHAAQRRRERR